MTIPQAHGVQITYIPLDGVGMRQAGNIVGQDMNLGSLVEIISGIEEDLDRTKAALAVPELNDLAIAVRGALIAIQSISFHLLEMHDGLDSGTLNYHETAKEARTRIN